MTAGSAPRQSRKDKAFALDPEMHFWHDRPRAFVKLWQSLVPPGLAVPPRKLFTPEILRSFLSYLLIIEMDETRQRYRNRLVGTEIAARAGRDTTGRWFEDIYSPETLGGHHRAHQWILEHRRPVRTQGTLDFVDRGYMPVEAAAVPLSIERPDYIEQFMICVAYGDLQMPDQASAAAT
jgi:hypothetical protein